MKKFYFLLAAALIASTASAKVDYSQKHSQMKTDRPVMVDMPEGKAIVTTDQAAPDNMPLQLKAQPVEGDTYYFRPHGSFYVGYNPMVSRVYYSPYLYLPNYRDVTFQGTKVANWSYQKWDRTVGGRPWVTVENEQNLTLRFVTETDSVPSIYDASGEYCLFGHNANDEVTPVTLYSHNDLATRLASNTNGNEGWFASPKYWASRDRDLAYSGITRYLTGALDSDGGNTAFWFGKNYTGWNACAIYCEKPDNPYVIRGAAIRYAFYMSPEPVELTMRIYKVAAHEPREMAFGDLIAEGTATLPASPGEETSGGLYFTFTEVEEEYGLISEITPEIDDEIYVVLSGYDNDAIMRFAVPLCADVWDEGIGETGYNIQLDEDGNVGTARSLNAMFTGFKGYSAPGIFLDVVYPFLINNYTNDPSVRKYDAAGTLTYDGTEDLFYGSNFSAYSTEPAEQWDITLSNGQDVPSWVTLTPQDEYNESGEFSGEVNVGIAVEPLPEGVAARQAVIRFSIPGHHHDLTIIQGDESALPSEFYLVGTFNGWNQTEEGGRLVFTATDEEGVYETEGTLEDNAEFKIITPNGDGWTWLGGVDENQVGFFLINEGLLNVPLALIDGSNFRVEEGGKFTFSLNANDMTLTVVRQEITAIPGDVNGDGVVTSADVTLLYNILLNNDYEGVVNADQNGDGDITSADVTAVYNILLGS